MFLSPRAVMHNPLQPACCKNISCTNLIFRDAELCCPHCGKQIKVPRFGPSRVSVLQVPDFCPRCFYLLLNMRFDKPFDFGTPYVMQLLDKHQKRVAAFALGHDGKLPKFFGPFTDAIAVRPVDWLSCYHPDTHIQLFGYTDLFFDFEEDTSGIIDDKTALVKGKDSPLHHMYTTQCNLYKYMSEHGPVIRKISQLGLLYYECASLSEEQMEDSYNDEEVWVRFCPRFVEVDGSGSDELVETLLKRLRWFLDLREAPQGKKGCEDCAIIAEYKSKLADYIRPSQLGFTDRREYERAGRRWQYKMADGDRTVQLINALRNSTTNKYGVLANWDWSE